MKQYLVISMYGMSLYDEEMQVHDVILRNSEEISIKAAMEYVTYYSKNNRPRWAVMVVNVLEGKVVFSKAHNPPAKKRKTLNEKPVEKVSESSKSILGKFAAVEQAYVNLAGANIWANQFHQVNILDDEPQQVVPNPAPQPENEW